MAQLVAVRLLLARRPVQLDGAEVRKMLADVPATARIFKEEVFGPVAPVIGFDTEASWSMTMGVNLRVIGRGAYGEIWMARSLTGALRAVVRPQRR